MRNDFKKINIALESILNNYNLKKDYEENLMFSKWSFLVGPQISKFSKPLKYENKILTISVNSDSWRAELKAKKKSLIEMINSSLETITVEDILFI
ncbi:MAG: DUF721 domain-containing protein [Calditrichaceae bacterium]